MFKNNCYDKELYGNTIDLEFCDLKAYQDLLIFSFIKENIPIGSIMLDVGGGVSRIINHFKKDYECWNIDKLEGAAAGPRKIDTSGFRMVHDYMGNFNKDLPENYFDLVFSISTLEHAPHDDFPAYENIRKDINRVLKPGGYSCHCVDIVWKKSEVWTNSIIQYLFEHEKMVNEFIPVIIVKEDPDLFFMSKKYYDRSWLKLMNILYEDFGKPASYNFLWRKT